MTVQLLEDWLLKEQEKIKSNQSGTQSSPPEGAWFDLLSETPSREYFPIHEPLQSPKHMVNRGVRGYKTDLLREHLDAHVFGTARWIRSSLLIGTNDIGKEFLKKGNLGQM